MESNRELARLYDEDQADRSDPIAFGRDPSIYGRDAERRVRVSELVEEAALHTGDDYFRAAMIFQHGGEIADIERAHELALRANEIAPTHAAARWLVAASEDRALMYREQPQRWGTQFKVVEGEWILWPIDPATTDADRARWGVPALAEQQQTAAQMNEDVHRRGR